MVPRSLRSNDLRNFCYCDTMIRDTMTSTSMVCVRARARAHVLHSQHSEAVMLCHEGAFIREKAGPWIGRGVISSTRSFSPRTCCGSSQRQFRWGMSSTSRVYRSRNALPRNCRQNSLSSTENAFTSAAPVRSRGR